MPRKQATLLLAQQLQFEEQRKRFEEERTQLVAEKARLVEKQNAIRQQNAKQAKELEENPNPIKRLTKTKWFHCFSYTKTLLRLIWKQSSTNINRNGKG